MYPKVLEEIRDFIAKTDFSISEQKDGRIGSVDDEATIISLLIDAGFDVEEMPPRFWYDMKVNDGDTWYPVNIKSTAGYHKKNRDNAGSKQGMLYAFTDVEESELEIPRMKESFFNSTLATRKKDMNRTYYYLVINKQDTSEVLLTDIKALTISDSTISTARFNLPFQVNWVENHIPVNRSFDEGFKHVVGQYQKAVRARMADFADIDKLAV